MLASVVATTRYERDAKRLWTTAEKAAFEQALAADPEGHPVIPGTGGLRKARWSRQNKGKRGGVRVIYYFWNADDELFLLFVYAKNEQADMTAEDRKAARKFVEALRHAKEERQNPESRQ